MCQAERTTDTSTRVGTTCPRPQTPFASNLAPTPSTSHCMASWHLPLLSTQPRVGSADTAWSGPPSLHQASMAITCSLE